MRKRDRMLRLSFNIVILVVSGVLLAFTANAEYFYIRDYHVSVYINRDATVFIDETIGVHFTSPRHGIIRKVPYRYRVYPSARLGFRTSSDYYTISIYNVKVDGFKYKTYRSGNYLFIRIGDPNSLVRGDVTYRIQYTVYGVINFFKDHSEFYYNIIGFKWPVKIEHASFDVTLPVPLNRDRLKYLVFSGSYGSKHTERVSYADGVLSCDITHALGPYQGVTLVLSLPKGVVKKSVLASVRLFVINNKILALPLFLFFILFALWYHMGRDRKVPIMALYKPPEGITPAEAGVLINDRVDNHDLISLVFWWANKGYLQIEEREDKDAFFKKKDLILIKRKDLPEDAKEFEKIMFNGLFPGGVSAVRVSSLKNKFYKTMRSVRESLNRYIKEKHLYREGSRALGRTLYTVGMLVAIFGTINFLGKNTPYMVAFLLSGILLIVFGRIMPQKTAGGLKEYAAVKGFKEFMDRVEKDRLKRLLDNNPGYFYETLAYAVAFGELKKWADKFKDFDMEPPNWYKASYHRGFNVAVFSESLNDSVGAMRSAFVSSPAASGSSGFSGGASAGGGSGGGGGSSW